MEKLKILRARKGYSILPTTWNGGSQTHERQEEIHGVRISVNYYYLDSNNKFYSGYKPEDWKKGSNHIKEKLLEGDSYLSELYPKQKELGERLVGYSEKIQNKNLSELGKEKLLDILKRLKQDWFNHEFFNLFPWFLGGDEFESEIRNRLEKIGLNAEEIEASFTPPELSFSTEEELDTLELAEILLDKKESLDGLSVNEAIEELDSTTLDKLDSLVDLYYWIPFGYSGPDIYDRSHYIKKIQKILKERTEEEISGRIDELSNYSSEVKKQHKEIINKYNIDNRTWKLVERVHTLNYLTDERKEHTFPAHIAVDRVLKQLEETIGLTKNNLKMFTIEELEKNKEATLEKEAEKRNKGQVLCTSRDGKTNITRDEGKIKKVREALQLDEKKEKIEGTVGSKGKNEKTKGIVKILPTPDSLNKLDKGEVLVTSMTSPEFVPAMRRASAIITDEGGMTCHAAIVSRELDKPCIIGTRDATRILEDGDRVEVDTEEGEVNIINTD